MNLLRARAPTLKMLVYIFERVSPSQTRSIILPSIACLTIPPLFNTKTHLIAHRSSEIPYRGQAIDFSQADSLTILVLKMFTCPFQHKPVRLTKTSPEILSLVKECCGDGSAYDNMPMLTSAANFKEWQYALINAALKDNTYDVLAGIDTEFRFTQFRYSTL